MSNEPVIYLADEKGRVEVDRSHFYSSRCRCEACLSFFLAHKEGLVVVKSQAGETLSHPNKKKARTWVK